MIRIILPLKRPGGSGRFAAAGGSPLTAFGGGRMAHP